MSLRVPRVVKFGLVVAGLLLVAASARRATRRTDHVILVMTDGLRWQEVFGGADPTLMNRELGNVADLVGLKRAYWRESVEARREALMPFLWSVVAKRGQIFGDRAKGSEVALANGLLLSYPGYSETLCGFADPRVQSNDKIPNPNVTVLEWLNAQSGLQGRVAAFAAWAVMPFILNAERAGFVINAGYEPLTTSVPTPQLDLLNKLKAELPQVWEEEPFDPLTFYTALEFFKEKKPKVLFLSLGDTDDWAHEGKYASYLDSAHRVDAYLKTLWETAQSIPEYRDRTTLIVTTDHGRGDTPEQWTRHGDEVVSARYTWAAFLGPDTTALGARENVPPLSQDQIAATLATLLGKDYLSQAPRAGKPIADVLPR
jgi:hypothetical protein